MPPTFLDNDVLPPLSLPRKDLPVGGRLAHFQNRWGEITEDSWVLSVVRKGYKIPFICKPPLFPTPIFLQQTESLSLEEEVNKLLLKGAVEKIEPEGPGFYSRIFLVPKKNGKITTHDRSVQTEHLSGNSVIQDGNSQQSQTGDPTQRLGDLPGPDRCVLACSHSQTVPEVPPILSQGSDVSVQGSPVRPCNKSLCLYPRDGCHSNLSTEEGNCTVSVPGRLVGQKSDSSGNSERSTVYTKLITSLGLIINEEKSDLVPSQNFVFIGMEFLTQRNIVRVPLDRTQGILELLRWFVIQEQVSARVFLSLLGKLSAASQFVVLGKLHLRPLQMALFAQWKPHAHPLEHPILINAQIRQQLEWWNNKGRFISGVTLKPSLPTRTLFTDASLSGWGAHLEPEGLLCHGVWTPDQSVLHINILEMKAILLALKQCHQYVANSTVLIATDNSSVVSYLKKQGGTHSPSLCMEVWDTLLWCNQEGIDPLVRHLPGKSNILADRLSRLSKPIATEWTLDQTICNSILSMTGFPNVDLFATRLNKRLPLYVSPIPDANALAIDAMSMNWDGMHAYAFPPFALIPAIINKIRQHHCKIVLVAPLWAEMSWFPDILRLLVAPPIRIPSVQNLLTQVDQRLVHQNPGNLKLHAWSLSADLSQIESFRRTLPGTPLKQGDRLPDVFTTPNGRSFPIGVVKGKLILSMHLRWW